jgi:hypothetical protein
MFNDQKTKFNPRQKELRELLTKKESFNEGRRLFSEQYNSVHLSDICVDDPITMEDYLWYGLDEETFSQAKNRKDRTIAYVMWHSARIEDMSMNILVNDDTQVIDNDNWVNRINATIYDTGNSLTSKAMLEFSTKISEATCISNSQLV